HSEIHRGSKQVSTAKWSGLACGQIVPSAFAAFAFEYPDRAALTRVKHVADQPELSTAAASAFFIDLFASYLFGAVKVHGSLSSRTQIAGSLQSLHGNYFKPQTN